MAYERLRFESDGGGSTKAALTCEQIKNLRTLVPPQAEQQAIVDYLAGYIAGSALLEQEAERAISLLRERRSALVSAAVTGQIDVRSVGAAVKAA
jgi:type I restriction enzyme S subunit